MKRKIIVLTPVKNEEWILETFLRTTSVFADHIILADQDSTDKTVEIAKSFSKVTIIKNQNESYDESSRQHLLLETARTMFGLENILLAIDADEIISYNGIHSKEWDSINNAKPGTVLYFEKPTFYQDLNKVIRYDSSGGWPLGFVDNGAKHQPTLIHSTRIPFSEAAPRLYLNEIKFLHCNLLSLQRQRSKIRYYCLLEAIAKTKPWYRRALSYNRKYDYSMEGDGLSDVNVDWIKGWMEKGIIISKPDVERYFWYDKECLRLFQNEGSRKFWMEDVWDVNWKDVIKYYKEKDCRVVAPPTPISLFRDTLYFIVRVLSSLKLVYAKVLR